jgi:hypothetical protein
MEGAAFVLGVGLSCVRLVLSAHMAVSPPKRKFSRATLAFGRMAAGETAGLPLYRRRCSERLSAHEI